MCRPGIGHRLCVHPCVALPSLLGEATIRATASEKDGKED